MAGSRALATNYLGLALKNPFVVGASPLADDVDSVRRLEDAGCAAIVMRSLFEEQITAEQSGRIHHLDPLNPQFTRVLEYFPPENLYALAPDRYLEQLRKTKAAVSVPVIGSLNGTSRESWLEVAAQMEQAGADALELNMYEVVTDFHQSAAAIEHDLGAAVSTLKRAVNVPVAVKLSPFYTALAHVARELDRAGADGLVLFNRFYQPDFDIETLAVTPRLELSTNSELPLRLQWASILHGRVRPALAICGGVAQPEDAVKAILAGADVVQMVAAILRNGPGHIGTMREGLTRWLDAHAIDSVEAMRGRLSLVKCPDPGAFERGYYIRTLGIGRADDVTAR